MVTSTVPSLADSSAPLSVSGTTRAARGFQDNAGSTDRRAKGRSGAQLPTTGDRRQIAGPAAPLGADIADQLVEVGVPADHGREHGAWYRLRGGENHRLDAAHPFAPAHLARQVLQFDVELRSGAAAGHRRAPPLISRRGG